MARTAYAVAVHMKGEGEALALWLNDDEVNPVREFPDVGVFANGVVAGDEVDVERFGDVGVLGFLVNPENDGFRGAATGDGQAPGRELSISASFISGTQH